MKNLEEFESFDSSLKNLTESVDPKGTFPDDFVLDQYPYTPDGKGKKVVFPDRSTIIIYPDGTTNQNGKCWIISKKGGKPDGESLGLVVASCDLIKSFDGKSVEFLPGK